MAVTSLNLHDTKTLSHPDDKENPTLWTIGAVDSRTYGKLSDKALVVGVDPSNPDADADIKMARNQLAFEVVQFGLKGFENYRDAKGGEVQFVTEPRVIGPAKYDVAAESVLKAIPGHILQWLAREIMAINALKDDEGNA